MGILCRLRKTEKGQSLVEFALLLGFAAAIVLSLRDSGLLKAAGVLVDNAERILGEINHHRTYDVSLSVGDIVAIQANGNYSESGGANRMNYLRGQMRSGWVDKFPEDSQMPGIKRLYDELGASQWTFYNGLGNVYVNKPSSSGFYVGDKGLFWTSEELHVWMFTPYSTVEGQNYSLELVLEYFYSTNTGKYYVIKSHVWVNQKDLANGVALGGFHQQLSKPPGYFVDGCTDGFDTLLEAKQLFEKVRSENGYSVVFASADPERDVSAKDHVF